MIYEERNPSGTVVTRADLVRRQEIETLDDTALLSALFSTAGVVYGMSIGVQGEYVTIGGGQAVVLTAGELRLVQVPLTQNLPVPQQDGPYDIYLNNNASVLLDPVVIAGSPPRTDYGRRAHLAYAPDGVSPSYGRVETVGVLVQPSASPLGSGYTLIGRINRTAGVVTVDPSLILTPASLRGATTGSGGPSGSAITETDLDTALRAKIDGAIGAAGLQHDLDANSKNLFGVGSISGVGVNDLVEANVSRLGGKTLQQIESEIGSGSPSTPAQSFLPLNFNGVVPLSASIPAPRPMLVNLPTGSIQAGKSYALAYEGEGTLSSRSNLALTFNPTVRMTTEVSAPWLQKTGTIIVGDIRGVSGSLGAFFCSILTVVSSTEIKMTLQKVTPGTGSATVTVFDSDTVTKLAGDPVPQPYSLNLSGGELVWGGRSEGVLVAATGDPADPAVTVLSSWVRGYRLSRADVQGITLQTASLAVVGTGLLVESATAIPTLTVAP